MENNLTPPLAGEPAGAASGQNVNDVKTVLETTLGKQFPDEATALKAVKDTFSAVGAGMAQAKVLQAVAEAKGISTAEAQELIMNEIVNAPKVEPGQQQQAVDPNKFVSRDEFDKANFFAQNPQYNSPETKEIIEALQTKTGKTVAEVVELPSFKTVFEKVAKVDEVERSRSVLHSNPRLGQVTDKVTESKQQQQAGKQKAAAASAVDAVVESLQIK